MKKILQLFFLLFAFTACQKETKITQEIKKEKDTYVQDNYTKQEVDIVMRSSARATNKNAHETCHTSRIMRLECHVTCARHITISRLVTSG